MEKTEIRAVIKYLHLKGMKGQDIHNDMVGTLGDSAPSYATVKRWISECKRGRTSTESEPNPGRPSDASCQENIDAVQDMILSNRRHTVRKIAETMGIGTATAHHIISEVLGYHKVCARWVPRMLTNENRRTREQSSRENLELFNHNPEDFCARYVTMDETWAHHFDPETKQQSMQWKHPESPREVKFRKMSSAGKVMASVFWDAKGVLMVDYLERGKTITGAYYAGLLHKLRDAIKEKRRGKLSKKIIFHQDNAPAHTSNVAMAAIHDCGFELLSHPPYSPDLAPSDFHLFRHLKESLRGTAFEGDEDVISAVNQWFQDQDEKFFLEGVQALKHRWEKCVQLRGDYVEKL